MPKIPEWTRTESLPAVAGNVMANPEAMSRPSLALAAAGKRVGDKYSDLFMAMKAKIDAAETLKAIDDFRNEQRNYINEQRNIVGKNVIDVSGLTQNEADKGKDLTTRATEWHQKMADTYANNLSSDDQRDIFYRLVRNEIDSGINQVANHQAVQTRQYFADQIDYTIDTAIKDIQDNPSEDTANRAKLKVATVVQAIYPGQNVDDYKLHALNRIDTATKAIMEREKKTAEIRDGINIGVSVFKQDTTGSIEKMTDAVRAQKLSPESEKVAIRQIKELYNERKIDDENKKKAVFDDAYNVLTQSALAGGGRLNRLSDLPPSKWAELMAIDPKTTMQIQDKISAEQRQQANINKAEARAYLQEQRLRQADNESEIIISDDFNTRNLKEDLAIGKISPVQYRKLAAMQEKLDPVKRFSVKAALSKVTSGTAINKALGVKGNEAAIWKLKYGDLIKSWAYKNADDPNFDDNLNKYVEKYILSDMVESWFASDESDRLEKYKKAKEVVGELPKKINAPTQEDLEYTAKKHGLTVDQVKKKLGIK